MGTVTSPPATTTHYRWAILAAVLLVQTVVSMVWFSFGPLAPFLVDTFHITRAQVGLFTAFNSLAVVFFAMLAGWLVDRFGIRRLMLIGPGALGVLYALFSQAPTIAVAYGVIFAAGLGWVFVTPATTLALVHWFPSTERGTAVSIKQAGLPLGSAIGAIIIPSLALLAGWRTAAAVLGLAEVVFVVVAFAIYRERRVSKPGVQPPALRAFRQVLTNKPLLHLGLVGAAYTALQFIIVTYLVLQFVEARGMSEVAAGAFLMVTNMGGIAGRVMFGLFSDKVFRGQRWQVLTLLGIMSGAIAVFLAVAGDTASEAVLYVMLTLFGFTALGWNGVLLAGASEMASKETAATALGMTQALCNVGGVIGPPVFGYIVDQTLSYTLAWLLAGAIVIAAGISVVWTRKGLRG